MIVAAVAVEVVVEMDDAMTVLDEELEEEAAEEAAVVLRDVSTTAAVTVGGCGDAALDCCDGSGGLWEPEHGLFLGPC